MQRSLTSVISALTLAVAASTLDATPPQSRVANAILEPHDLAIEVRREALQEIKRQSEERIKELEDWRAFYSNTATAAFDGVVSLVDSYYQDRVDRASKALAMAKSFFTGGVFSIPGLPANATLDGAKRYVKLLEKGHADIKSKLASKTHRVRVAFVGVVTDMASKVTGVADDIRGVQKRVRTGVYKIHHPTLGEVWGELLDRGIAGHEKSKKDLIARFKQGDYKVWVPGVGTLSRNTLEKKIKSLEDRLASMRKGFKSGEARVWRPLFRWQSQNTLRKIVADQSAWVVRQSKWRTGSVLEIAFPGIRGAMSYSATEKAKKKCEATIAEIRKQVADGTYKIGYRGGLVDRKKLEAMQRDAQRAASNPKLTQKGREAVRKRLESIQRGFEKLQKVSALDLALHAMTKNAWSKRLAMFLQLAKPQLEAADLNLQQHRAHLGDFARELTLAEKALLRELERLKAARQFLP